jgi:ribonuclease HI
MAIPKIQQNQTIPTPPGWTPPPVNCVKIKVDGAVLNSANMGAYSAICRDEHGTFVGASVVSCEGVTDPTVLESLACRKALS